MTATPYYSQKTGDYSGDVTAWNTAPGGGGSSGDPTEDDLRVVQSGHTISSIENHIGSPIIVEAGGVWDKGSYHVQQKGSILNYAGSTGLVSSGGEVYMMVGAFLAGIPENYFNNMIIEEAADVQVLHGSQIKEDRPIVSRGTLDAVDAALSFASTGRVEVPDDATLKPSTGSMAINLILKWNTGSPTKGYIASKTKLVGSPIDGWVLEYTGTAIEFTIFKNGGGSPASWTMTPVADRPYFITCRRSGGGVYLYVDGVLRDTAVDPTGDIDNTEDLVLGNYDLGLGWLWHHQGTIIDFRHWIGGDKDLDDHQAIMLYGTRYNGSDMRCYLKLDEATGTDCVDSSGEGNAGALAGATATWEDEEELIVDNQLIVGPLGTLRLPSGKCRSLIYHGAVEVVTGRAFVFSDRTGGIGTLTGSLHHTSYHTTTEEIAIDEDTFADLGIVSMLRDKARNKISKLDIAIVDTPTVHNYVEGLDTVLLEYSSQTLFKGKLWRRKTGSGNSSVLTFYDYLFDLKKMKVLRWIFGNLHQWKVTDVTKVAAPVVDLTGFYSGFFHRPVADITFLKTFAKQLDVDDAVKMDVGYTGALHKFAARYFIARDNAGDILRIAVNLGNKTGVTGSARSFYIYIYDMDNSSPSHDKIIWTGTIAEADVPVGATNSSWIIKNVISASGRIKCPKFFKIVVGSVTSTGAGALGCSWFGKETPLFDNLGAKWGYTSGTEADISWYVTTYDPGGANKDMGVALAAEVEAMGDWLDSRDPNSFDYGISDMTLQDTEKLPEFANITRFVSGTYSIARVTVWHDSPSIDDYIGELCNSWGRWFFNKLVISVDNVNTAPFLVMENTDPLAEISKLCDYFKGDFSNTFSGGDVKFEADALISLAGWSFYSDDEKIKRTAVLSEDLKHYPALERYLLEKYMGSSFNRSVEQLSRQAIIQGADGKIPIYSDYDQVEPFYPTIHKLTGDLDQLVDLGEGIIDDYTDVMSDGGVDLIDMPIDSDNIFLSTNDLFKIVDTRRNWSRISKIEKLAMTFSGGRWKWKIDVNEDLNFDLEGNWLRSYKTGLLTGNFRPGGPSTPAYAEYNPGTLRIGGGIVLPGSEFNPSNLFEVPFEVNSSFSNTGGTWWLMLGSSSASPLSLTMQTASQDQQIIVPAERIDLGGGKVILVARITEEFLLGEFNDTFEIHEIGAINNVGKPAFSDACDTRVVLWLPNASASGYVSDLISTGEIYRPSPYFLRNGVLHVTYGHIAP